MLRGVAACVHVPPKNVLVATFATRVKKPAGQANGTAAVRDQSKSSGKARTTVGDSRSRRETNRRGEAGAEQTDPQPTPDVFIGPDGRNDPTRAPVERGSARDSDSFLGC